MKKLLLFSCVLLANNIHASVNTTPKKTVNVTAFYGFLEDPKIKEAVEKQCHVSFSHDAYYTNAEFLRDFYKHKDSYDVMIFSNMVYGSIKNQLPNIEDSDLWKSSAEYYPYFREYYTTHNTIFK